MSNTRRKDPRLNEACALLARSLGRIANEGLHRTHDLGLKGCSFTSRTPYGLGTRLKLAVTVEHKVLGIEGKVVRETGDSREGYTVGVEFTALERQAREMLESLFFLERFTHRDEEEFAALGMNAAG